MLKEHPSFPNPEVAPERDLLNCIRVLTRLLPYIYEADHLAEWDERFFWGARRRKSRKGYLPGGVIFDEGQTQDLEGQEDVEQYEAAKPLAEELIDNLIELLFFSGFTVPQQSDTRSKVTYAIWQSGIGCKTSIGTNKELESNRCEVLRLLLTLTSKSMYMSSTFLPTQGTKALTYMTTCPDKQMVLSVLCSLLNTTIKYNSTTWRLPYDHVIWNDPKQSLVIYSLQLLLVLLVYPIPEDSESTIQKNYYRHFLGRIHRPEDFQFLADGLARVLSQPMQATTSYLPGSQKSVRWGPEIIMLFWEALQCNKRFRAFILESNRAHDFIVLMLFYAIEYKTDATRQGIVRMCVFILQTMSVEAAFGENMNKPFDGQETLPASIRIPNFRGTYADFLIISIHVLITGSKGKLDAIYPALLAIVNNLAPYAQNLSMVTCSKLLQLFGSMSTPSFLLANDANHALLQSLLEAINSTIEYQYSSNANLIYNVLRSRKRVEALRKFTLDGGQHELERAAKRRKEGFLGSGDTPTSPTFQSARSPDTSYSHTMDDHSAFAIGDSEDSEGDDEDGAPNQPTPSHSSHASRTPSLTPSVDDSDASHTRSPQSGGLSARARGKQPATLNSSRSNTADNNNNEDDKDPASLARGPNGAFTPTAAWLETWLPDLPLHTFLTLIKALSPHLPSTSTSTTTTPSSSSSLPPPSTHRPSTSTTRIIDFLTSLPTSQTHPLIQPILSHPTPHNAQPFIFTPLLLSWYLSLLYSLIFVSESTIGQLATAATLATNVVGGHAVNSSPIGVWNGTRVKLFHVQTFETSNPSVNNGAANNPDGGAPGSTLPTTTTNTTMNSAAANSTIISAGRKGPSLREPRGAVDAVGRRLVDGVFRAESRGPGRCWEGR